MKRPRFAIFVVLAVFAPRAALAAPGAKQLLSGTLQEAQRAGFYGADSTPVPEPPAALVSPIAAQAQPAAGDHAKDVLKKFATEILASNGVQLNVYGPVARKLGFSPTPSNPWNADGSMPIKGIFRRNNTTKETKSFGVTDVRGKTEIIIGYEKEGVEARSYLVAPDGKLVVAVLETTNGISEIPAADAQAGYENELGFWVRYYDRTHP